MDVGCPGEGGGSGRGGEREGKRGREALKPHFCRLNFFNKREGCLGFRFKV